MLCCCVELDLPSLNRIELGVNSCVFVRSEEANTTLIMRSTSRNRNG